MFILKFNVVSYTKFKICMLGRYVSLLLGGGWPREKTAPVGAFKFSGFLKALVNDGASFLRRAGSPPRHQTPVGTRLPGSPSLLAWPKSARLLPLGLPVPQAHHWQASPLCRSTLLGVPTPPVHYYRVSPPRRRKFSPGHSPPIGGGRHKCDASNAYIC
jgi:hypothetical protein